MTQHQSRSIPLKQRFQNARIHKIAANALELTMLDTGWADQARVISERLPSGKKLEDFHEGQEIRVFLLGPSSRDQKLFHASIAWADETKNPWLTTPPHKGELVEIEVQREGRNTDVVFVILLQNLREPTKRYGIDAALLPADVPGRPKRVLDAVDIHDHLVAEVVDVDPGRLNVKVSVREALTTLGNLALIARNQAFGKATVELIPRSDWEPHIDLDMVLGVLGPDAYFTAHLADWLEAFGCTVIRYRDSLHLQRVLAASNRPPLLLCDKEAWPKLKPDILGPSAHRPECTLYWIGNGRAPFAAAGELPLPLDVGALLTILAGSGQSTALRRRHDVEGLLAHQARQVQDLASELLEKICEELGLLGALWVAEEQKGRYEIRASYEINEGGIESLEPKLGQTLFHSVIDHNKAEVWPIHKLGALRYIAPVNAEGAICIPVPIREPGEQNEKVQRAVAFFLSAPPASGAEDNPSRCELYVRLQPYVAAMQALVHCLRFARHNEQLAAFADLGRHATTYLHELRQRALPLRGYLDAHPGGVHMDAPQWQRLEEQLRDLVTLAYTDLDRIGRGFQRRLRLRERMERLADLYAFRFNTRDCAFGARLPDHPMSLDLDPLVVEQVVSNLLDNALAFAGQRSGGRGRVSLDIRLDLTLDPLRPLIIEVADNGPGVRSGIRDDIFHPRYSGRDGGTGMGLFIARGFVRDLGGELDLVDNRRWYRTCFQVRLPVLLNTGEPQ